MTAIPIGKAERRAKHRLLELLTSSIFTNRLGEVVESDPFDLPRPETWVVTRLNLSRHWRALNVNRVCGVISPTDDATTTGESTGDGRRHSALSQMPIDVGIVMKAPDAFPAVTTQGRQMLDDEVMAEQADRYREALLDIVPRHAQDPTSIHEVFIENREASLFEVPEMGRYAHATVTFRIEQDVLINH